MKRKYINQEHLLVGELVDRCPKIEFIHELEKTFSTNPLIIDNFLRVSVWQILESFNGLEESANMTFSSMEEIEHFMNTTDHPTHQIMARNVIQAFDSLVKYVKS